MFYKPQLGNPLSAQAVHELQLLYTVPPNIMRLIMLSTMALLVAIAVYRSRKRIETVARDTEIAVNRDRFLPSGLSDIMTDDKLESLRSGVERDLSVMFVDIRGFTQLSEMAGPRETAKFLTHYRSLIVDAVSVNNGVVDKFIGDGVLIIHGLHTDINQACADSIITARLIMLQIEAWNERREIQSLDGVKIAIGVHAGPAIIGAIGDDKRLEFTAIGNTVNLASRLENIAKKRNWRLAVSSYAAAVAEVNLSEFISTGPIDLKGSSAPMEVFGKA
jgi:adenylate cyclase